MTTHDPATSPERTAKLRMRVTVVYKEGEQAIIARVLELPGAISQGESLEGARANVLDAATLLLESYHKDNVAPELVTIVAVETHALDVPLRDLERHLRAHGCERRREGATIPSGSAVRRRSAARWAGLPRSNQRSRATFVTNSAFCGRPRNKQAATRRNHYG